MQITIRFYSGNIVSMPNVEETSYDPVFPWIMIVTYKDDSGKHEAHVNLNLVEVFEIDREERSE